jgi:hypothetical protein
MQTVKIGHVTLSRFILGSNPFSGFSHQGADRDQKMMHWYTAARIKQVLFQAESLGITALTARTDHHVMRVLMEYRDEGGKLQWFAQTCPGAAPTEQCISRAASLKAAACHIHGGVMDQLLASGETSGIQADVDRIRKRGMIAGVAGHNVGVFEWAEKHLDCDYYMCCYYNPIPRNKHGEHVPGAQEEYRSEDRDAMLKLIPTLKRPVIHYKVFAAGRNDPKEAITTAVGAMRPTDAMCVGVFTGDNPRMLEEDVKLFEAALAGA